MQSRVLSSLMALAVAATVGAAFIALATEAASMLAGVVP